jgi:dipeptidyl aminopeptidase/acylaminoacyl peptidase
VVNWKATDGHEVEGGVYLPVDFVSGRRYPLVIQTHGFNSDRFWIDGPWSTAFAAQPLAGKGFVVLQVGSSKDAAQSDSYIQSPKEGPRMMAEFEGAIDYLDHRGLIDRDRVAIIGFSRTVYHVAYTLTHSKYHFAAATLADGIDGGYFQYLAFPNSPGDNAFVNGGPPLGEKLVQWLHNSPGFNLDKVRTPMRLEAHGPGSLLGAWEWFAGLSLQLKPVDLIYLPQAPHLLVRPSERLVSQQGNVDWFTFWLKGEEDPDPIKAAMYSRWRELRNLRQEER